MNLLNQKEYHNIVEWIWPILYTTDFCRSTASLSHKQFTAILLSLTKCWNTCTRIEILTTYLNIINLFTFSVYCACAKLVDTNAIAKKKKTKLVSYNFMHIKSWRKRHNNPVHKKKFVWTVVAMTRYYTHSQIETYM